jgi:outer membrane biosynthesis protein TonB
VRDLDSKLDPGYRGTRDEREPSSALVILGIATSILLHGAIVGLIIWGTMRGGEDINDEIEPKMLEFEDVELLALGEEKPPNQLPRLANPAPPEVEEDAVNLAEPEEEPEKEPDKEEEPPEEKREEPDEKRKKMLQDLSDLHNPNRPSNTDVPEGSDEGVAGGTISDAAMANMMKTYGAKLKAAIVKYWDIPSTFDEAEIKSLAGKVVVKVRLNGDGHITGYNFLAKSGDVSFDSSVERVLRKFQGGRSVPLPDDPNVRQAVLKQGLDLKNWDALGGR